MTTTILPCPFCGGLGEPRDAASGRQNWIECTTPLCRAMGANLASPGEAATAWNRRADVAATDRLRLKTAEDLVRDIDAAVNFAVLDDDSLYERIRAFRAGASPQEGAETAGYGATGTANLGEVMPDAE